MRKVGRWFVRHSLIVQIFAIALFTVSFCIFYFADKIFGVPSIFSWTYNKYTFAGMGVAMFLIFLARGGFAGVLKDTSDNHFNSDFLNNSFNDNPLFNNPICSHIVGNKYHATHKD